MRMLNLVLRGAFNEKIRHILVALAMPMSATIAPISVNPVTCLSLARSLCPSQLEADDHQKR